MNQDQGTDGEGTPPGGYDPMEGMGAIVWMIVAVAIAALVVVIVAFVKVVTF